jgi:hypothetical protein
MTLVDLPHLSSSSSSSRLLLWLLMMLMVMMVMVMLRLLLLLLLLLLLQLLCQPMAPLQPLQQLGMQLKASRWWQLLLPTLVQHAQRSQLLWQPGLSGSVLVQSAVMMTKTSSCSKLTLGQSWSLVFSSSSSHQVRKRGCASWRSSIFRSWTTWMLAASLMKMRQRQMMKPVVPINQGKMPQLLLPLLLPRLALVMQQ